MLLVAAALATSAALLARAAGAAAEVRVRRDVLCARYAALGGLALGAATASDGSACSLVGPRVGFLAVSHVRLAPSWCVRRATAVCGAASRTFDHTLLDTSACDAASP
jgi:hypothetical protein